MMSEHEMLVPMVLAIVRDILVSDNGAYDDLRVEADQIIYTLEGTTVRADIPHPITNVFEDGQKVASVLNSLLTGGV